MTYPEKNDVEKAFGVRWRLRVVRKPSIIVALSATIVVALFVPHVVDGHLLSLSNAVTQSLILSVDLAIAGVLILSLNREILRERLQKLSAEYRLDRSYRYIGKANVSLEIIRTVSSAVANARTAKDARLAFRDLHETIAAGVVRADAARTRFIAAKTGLTLTEFEWSRSGAIGIPEISNTGALTRAPGLSVTESSIHLDAGDAESGVICAFVAVGNPDELVCDRELMTTLMEFFRVLFIEYHLIRGSNNRSVGS